MLKSKFYLKNAKQADSLVICVVFQRSEKVLTVSTGIKTNPKNWNNKLQEFKPSSPVYTEGNNVLNNLRRKVLTLSIKGEDYESIEELKQFLRVELVGKTQSKNNLSFFECFELCYIEKVERLLTRK